MAAPTYDEINKLASQSEWSRSERGVLESQAREHLNRTISLRDGADTPEERAVLDALPEIVRLKEQLDFITSFRKTVSEHNPGRSDYHRGIAQSKIDLIDKQIAEIKIQLQNDPGASHLSDRIAALESQKTPYNAQLERLQTQGESNGQAQWINQNIPAVEQLLNEYMPELYKRDVRLMPDPDKPGEMTEKIAASPSTMGPQLHNGEMKTMLDLNEQQRLPQLESAIRQAQRAVHYQLENSLREPHPTLPMHQSMAVNLYHKNTPVNEAGKPEPMLVDIQLPADPGVEGSKAQDLTVLVHRVDGPGENVQPGAQNRFFKVLEDPKAIEAYLTAYKQDHPGFQVKTYPDPENTSKDPAVAPPGNPAPITPVTAEPLPAPVTTPKGSVEAEPLAPPENPKSAATEPPETPTSTAPPVTKSVSTGSVLKGSGDSVEAYDPKVEAMQLALIEAGVQYHATLTYTKPNGEEIAADGLEGPRTRAAVELYAKNHGLDLSTMSIEDFTKHVQEHPAEPGNEPPAMVEKPEEQEGDPAVTEARNLVQERQVFFDSLSQEQKDLHVDPRGPRGFGNFSWDYDPEVHGPLGWADTLEDAQYRETKWKIGEQEFVKTLSPEQFEEWKKIRSSDLAPFRELKDEELQELKQKLAQNEVDFDKLDLTDTGKSVNTSAIDDNHNVEQANGYALAAAAADPLKEKFADVKGKPYQSAELAADRTLDDVKTDPAHTAQNLGMG